MVNKKKENQPAFLTRHRRGAALSVAMACAALTCAAGLRAGETDDKKEEVAPTPPEIALKIHGLININFSDHYFTPRGLDVDNKGLTVQPLTLLFWDLYDNKSGYLNNVTLTTGFWNDFQSNKLHDSFSTANKNNNGYWNEIDPTAGISFTLLSDFKLSTTYTVFRSETSAYKPCQNVELTLGYDDSKFLKMFALHPYFGAFVEVANKATPEFLNGSPSYYLEFGIDPSYTLSYIKEYPVKFELPSYITFPGDGFYGSNSPVGVVGTGFKASVPLPFVSTAYGHWSVYGAWNFYSMQNPWLIKYGDLARGAIPLPHPNHAENVFSTGLTIAF